MKWTLLALMVVLALITSIALGPAAVPLADLLHSDIVWNLRVPRALLAFLVGGSLGVAGAGLQALVRNPLADPFLLGLSGGAGLGAVLAIALHLSGPWALPVAAFVGALAALGLVYRLGLVGGTGGALDPRILLLGGVAIGAFAAAVTTAIVSLADAAELRNAFLWLWGGLSGASWDTVLIVALYAPVPLVVLFAASRPLDLLALGEESAGYLGAEWRCRASSGLWGWWCHTSHDSPGVIGTVCSYRPRSWAVAHSWRLLTRSPALWWLRASCRSVW